SEGVLGSRVDGDLGGVAPLGGAAAGQHPGHLVQVHGGGDDGPGVDQAVGVAGDGVGQAAGGAEDAGGRDVLEDQGAGVEQAGLGGQADEADPAPRLDQVGGQGGQLPAGGGVDDRVEQPTGQAVAGPRLAETEGPGEPQRPLVLAQQVDVGAAGTGDQGAEQADRARAHDQDALALGHLGGLDHAQRVAARLDQGPGRGVDGIGERQQRRGRAQQLLAQGAGPAAADADLEPVG